MNESSLISATYDYRLVALSVVIAIFAAYTALELVTRVMASRQTAKSAWLMGGAVAMGTGIWSMHYTGMLAYRLPVPVYYHIPTVLLSLVAAIVASFIALYVVSRPRMTALHVGIGSLLMASGIGTMHYLGMAAMRLQAMHHFDTGMVIASVVVALVVSLAALGLTFQFREDKQEKALKIVCAVTMGFAIPAMHYTGMAAVSYMSTEEAPNLSMAVDISGLANAAIILITFIVLGAVFYMRSWGMDVSKKPASSQA